MRSRVLAHARRAGRATLVSRLRLVARLYGFPEWASPGKRGRKPKQGVRRPRLKDRAGDVAPPWRDTEVAWYEGARPPVRRLSGVSLWHTPVPGEPRDVVSNRSRFCQLTAVPAAYPHVGDLIQINFAKPAKNT